MRYIYHYHATIYKDGYEQSFIDGILDLVEPIQSMEFYREVRALIYSGEGKVSINSLTILGTLPK